MASWFFFLNGFDRKRRPHSERSSVLELSTIVHKDRYIDTRPQCSNSLHSIRFDNSNSLVVIWKYSTVLMLPDFRYYNAFYAIGMQLGFNFNVTISVLYLNSSPDHRILLRYSSITT